ncbi:hypothetical protein L3C95_18255 [Chitinophaga filiformis]|uniref:hypothetical protein n=1 Tax=Chitinophaga filiformis TaxID=104663 RepID=UPI001F1CE89E|nr:hypothetical protein [Chitinophaga filiformis]MCF6404848.1 hypothetical protein [Chitinophaga filiformis]
MKYFGIEAFDAKAYSDFPLEENEPLSSQWFFLTCDVGLLEYCDREFKFFVSIDWIGDAMDVTAPDNFFKVEVTGGRDNEFKIYHRAFIAPDLQKLKAGMQEAVDLVQHMRKLSEEEIDALPPIGMLITFIQENFPQHRITEDTILPDDLGIGGREALDFMLEVGHYFKFSLIGIDFRMFSMSEEELLEYYNPREGGWLRKDDKPVMRFTVKHLYAAIQNGEWFDPADA